MTRIRHESTESLRKRFPVLLGISLVVAALVMTGATFAEQELTVFNGGFETLPELGTLALSTGSTGSIEGDPSEFLGRNPYGWSVTATGTGDYWSVKLTDAKVTSGKYAMEIVVTSPKGGVLISSKPIAVTPGKTYAALWHVFNSQEPPLFINPVHLYMEFWSDDGWWGDTDYWSVESWKESRGGKWGTSKRVGVFWTPSKKFGEWEEVVVTGTAPSNARYVTLSMWVPVRTLKSYVDDIRLAAID